MIRCWSNADNLVIVLWSSRYPMMIIICSTEKTPCLVSHSALSLSPSWPPLSCAFRCSSKNTYPWWGSWWVTQEGYEHDRGLPPGHPCHVPLGAFYLPLECWKKEWFLRLECLQTFDQSDIWTKIEKTKRQKDKRTKGQKDKRQKDKKTKGHKDQKTKR